MYIVIHHVLNYLFLCVVGKQRMSGWNQKEAELEELLKKALEKQTHTPSEDEAFVLTLVPLLRQLSPNTKRKAKFNLHRYLFQLCDPDAVVQQSPE